MSEHIVIIGSSSPIASAAINSFLARGHRLSLVSRTAPPCPPSADSTSATTFYPFDLNNLEGIADLFNLMSKNDGEVSRLCFFQRYRDTKDSWEGEVTVGLRATENFVKAFHARTKIESDRSIVMVSSPADSNVVLEQPLSYHVTKAGLSQMIKYYACTLGSSGIRVNGVRPALVLKPRAQAFYEENPDLMTLFNRITPLGRMGQPSDIANAVLFLSSNEAAYITGQVLTVDGGLSVHESASLARLAASSFSTNLEDPRWRQK